MTRPAAAAALDPLRAPWTGIATTAAAGAAGAALAALARHPLLAGAAGGAALAACAGILALHIRRRSRQGLVDLLLLRLSSLLGWGRPERAHAAARGWHGGWTGRPAHIRISYSPLAADTLADIASSARRMAEQAFGVPYRARPQSRRDRAACRLDMVETEARGPDPHADQIAKAASLVAQALGAGAQVSTRFEGDALSRIDAAYEPALRLSSPALRARIEQSLSAQLPGRWRALWDLVHGTVRFEVRPSLSGFIPNPNTAPEVVDPRAGYNDLAVPVAVDEDGEVISWRPKRDPHGLITGKTGKGKTVALLGIIMFLAAHGWQIWGIDGKRIELLGLRERPNVALIAGRIDHQARVAHEMFAMMQKLFEDYEAGRVKLEDFYPVLFVIDEYKTFRNAVARWYRTVKPRGAPSQAPALEEISDFVSLARKVRMHLVVGLQRPDAEFLTGDMRDNFNFRISLGRLSPEGAKMMWGSYSIGVAIPPFAIGRGIARNAHGAPVEVQTYWTPDPYQTDPDHPEIWVDEDDLDLVRRLEPRETLHTLKTIVDPGREPDLDGGNSAALDYNDYMAAPIVPAGPRTRDDGHNRADAAMPAPAAEMARIQSEEAEPEIDDADELFLGYDGPRDIHVAELLGPDGELAADGTLVLIDPDTDTWGLVDAADRDPDDDCISIDYRDYQTGEPGMAQIPSDQTISARMPAEACPGSDAR